MKLVCISDTHGRHNKMPGIPTGDVLIHAGDCTASGSLPSLTEFAHWYRLHPHRHKILIAGNHDGCFESQPDEAREICAKNGITYLEDESTLIDGVKFFGSPWTPTFRNLAFNADESAMFEIRKTIPEDTHILVTHGPAYRIFDWVPCDRKHVGCYPLLQRMGLLEQLKAHICGHIHESHGYARRESDNVAFVNAAICTERYAPTNSAIVIYV